MARSAMLILLGCVALGSAQPVRSQTATPAVVYAFRGDLYAVAADGSRTVRLTKTRAAEFEPAVSPDGSKIAFARRFGGISAMNVDGSGRRIVTGFGDDPAWAPDGKTISFVRYRSGYGGEICGSISRVAATGGRVSQVTKSRGRHSHVNPAVSPDGQRIAFTDWDGCSGGTSSPRLRVVTPSGRPTGDLAKLPHNGYYPDPEHSCPSWSPDGEQLAFRRNADLTVARRDGSAERHVARGGDVLMYEAPSWSPDGSWIAFVAEGRAFAVLRLVHPDGTGLRRLARNAKGDDYSIAGWVPRLPR
jgi:Tol biopolymer transport system component